MRTCLGFKALGSIASIAKKKKIPRKTTNKETTRKLRKKYIKKEIKL
jgi:hypothetical protein